MNEDPRPPIPDRVAILPWTTHVIFTLEGVPIIAALRANWRAIRDEHLRAREHADVSRELYPLGISVGTWLICALRSNESEQSYMTAEIRRRTVESVESSAMDLTDAEIDAAYAALGEAQMACNRVHHPLLAGILEPHYPDDCSAYSFSLMEPGVVLEPHRGRDAGNIRVHLALIEDEGCMLSVAGEHVSWREGEVLAFDDHNEHWAAHAGTRDRLVLIVDFSKAFLARELARAAG